jgi:hypothetical protein
MEDDPDGPRRIPLADLKRAVLPLRFVFWGAVVNIVDITLRSEIGPIDLISDAAGMALVLAGTAKLARLRVDETYRKGTLFAAVVAALSLIRELVAYFPRWKAEPFVRGYGELVGLLEVAAMGVFCAMMVRLARSAELPDVAADWRRTLIWFLWIEVGLLGLLRAATTLWLLAGRPRLPLPAFDLSFWIVALLLLLGLLLWPWIRFFLSTNRLSYALRLKAWRRSLKPPAPGRRPAC